MGSPHTAPDMTLKDVIIGQLIKHCELGKPITQGNAQPICKIYGNTGCCHAHTMEIGGQRRFLPCVSDTDQLNDLVDNLRQVRDQQVGEVLKCVTLKRGNAVIDTSDLNRLARDLHLDINDIDITIEISPEIMHLLQELPKLDQVQTKKLREFLGVNLREQGYLGVCKSVYPAS